MNQFTNLAFVILGVTATTCRLAAESSAADLPGAVPIVAKHQAVFTVPPRGVPTRGMPDGPLLGNGDVGVVLAGTPEAQRTWFTPQTKWSCRCRFTM